MSGYGIVFSLYHKLYTSILSFHAIPFTVALTAALFLIKYIRLSNDAASSANPSLFLRIFVKQYKYYWILAILAAVNAIVILVFALLVIRLLTN